MEANADRCPRTVAALEPRRGAHPGTHADAAVLAAAPRARIPPHTGYLNARLICHLPLIVPPGCALRVGNEVREWREGERWCSPTP